MADFFSGGGGSSTNNSNLFGSGATSTSVVPGGVNAGFNNLYNDQLNNVINATGGLAKFGSASPLYFPGFVENGLYSRMAQLPDTARYTPQMQSGMDTLQGLINGGQGNAMPTLQQLLQQALAGPNSLEQGGLSTLQQRTDPTALTNAAQQYMASIVSPSATASAQAGGLGGMHGGALQEMLAKYGAGMALPIAQMIQQALADYGGAQMGMGGQLANRQSGLTSLMEQIRQGQVAEKSGLVNQNAGLSAQDIRPGLMQLLQQAAQGAAQPRQMQLQDFLRQQNYATGLLMHAPLIPSMTTTVNSNNSGSQSGTGTEQKDLTLANLLGPLTTLGAAGLLNPGGVSALGSTIGSGATGTANYLRSLFGNDSGLLSTGDLTSLSGDAYNNILGGAAGL